MGNDTIEEKIPFSDYVSILKYNLVQKIKEFYKTERIIAFIGFSIAIYKLFNEINLYSIGLPIGILLLVILIVSVPAISNDIIHRELLNYPAQLCANRSKDIDRKSVV
jgi:hypothetical protein